jgi:hypothetical protein
VEKHELSKIEFELIEQGLKALLDSHPDPVVAQKVADTVYLRSSRPAQWMVWWSYSVSRFTTSQIYKIELRRITIS